MQTDEVGCSFDLDSTAYSLVMLGIWIVAVGQMLLREPLFLPLKKK
jgi:hypothetical protein